MCGVEGSKGAQREGNKDQRRGHHSYVRPNTGPRVAQVFGHFERRGLRRRAAIFAGGRRAFAVLVGRGGGGAGDMDRCFFGIAQRVNSLAEFDRHVGWLAEDDGEDLMARGDFAKVLVGFEADALELGDVGTAVQIVEDWLVELGA